jgi:hypothetical protein
MTEWIAVLQMKSWIVLSFLLGTTWAVGFLIQDGIQAILIHQNYKSKRGQKHTKSVYHIEKSLDNPNRVLNQ